MEYNNLASKLLLKHFWENQHLLPTAPPKAWMTGLHLASGFGLKTDIKKVEIRAPIFIIGTPRCGSTMLHDILSCHEKTAYITNTMDVFRDPTVFYAAEWLRKKLNLNVRGERYLRDSVEVDTASPSEGMRFWGQFLRRGPFDLYWPEWRRKDFSQAEIDKGLNYIKSVLYCFIKERGGDRFLNKSPALVTEVRLIHDLFPDARFVHLVRDGRMVANSMIKLYRRQVEQNERVNHPLFSEKPFIPYPRVRHLKDYMEKWGAEDLRTTAHVWNDTVDFVNGAKDELTHFYEVRFEDLLADPAVQLQKIMDFCDLPPMTTGRARFEKKVAGVGRVHHKNRYSGFDEVEAIAADNLKRYGYL